MKIIAALGNPGEKFARTRHNAGWIVLDSFLGDVKWTENKRLNALSYQQGDCLFIKPLTFMNNSGESIRKALDYYKLLPKSFGIISKKDRDLNDVLTVIHDDLDLELGKYKIATDSGSAGHNGIKSAITHLKTQKFTRLRLGIKNDLLRTRIPADKFVLQPFAAEEIKILSETIKGINLENIQ